MSDMRRARRPNDIDYSKLADGALRDVRSHARAEARQQHQLDADRRLWTRKVDLIEAECRRRGL